MIYENILLNRLITMLFNLYYLLIVLIYHIGIKIYLNCRFFQVNFNSLNDLKDKKSGEKRHEQNSPDKWTKRPKTKKVIITQVKKNKIKQIKTELYHLQVITSNFFFVILWTMVIRKVLYFYHRLLLSQIQTV